MYTLIIGILLGVAATKLWEMKQQKGWQFSWLEYLLGAIWVLWVASGIAFVAINLGEGETRAASLGSLIFGAVALVAFLGLRLLHQKQGGRVSKANTVLQE